MMMEAGRAHSPLCSMCKRRIAPGRPWFRCSVSACNAGRLKLRFCSTACFDAHIPTARHRNASCVEEPPAAAEAKRDADGESDARAGAHAPPGAPPA
jgi:hypothetical protein